MKTSIAAVAGAVAVLTILDSLIDASPALHCEAGKGIPPFLIFYNTENQNMGERARQLRDSLLIHGIKAAAYPAQSKAHAGLNRDFAASGDEVGMLLADSSEAFFRRHLDGSTAVSTSSVLMSVVAALSLSERFDTFSLNGSRIAAARPARGVILRRIATP